MDPLHLRSAGTSLVVSFSSGEAEVIHWGADLGSELPDLSILTEAIPNSAIDATVPAGLLPQASSSWRGRAASPWSATALVGANLGWHKAHGQGCRPAAGTTYPCSNRRCNRSTARCSSTRLRASFIHCGRRENIER